MCSTTVSEKGGVIMSVRAHRVDNIEYQSGTFNLWYDEKVVEWLENHTYFFEYLTPDGDGLALVRVCDLKKMLEEIGNDLPKELYDAIQEDIHFVEGKGKDYVAYYCF